MANYSGTSAVNETLTGSAVDYVELTSVGAGVGEMKPGVTIVNVTGTSAIYVTYSVGGVLPPDPSVGGANCFVLPATVCSLRLSASTAPVNVKLISSGAMAYSVAAL